MDFLPPASSIITPVISLVSENIVPVLVITGFVVGISVLRSIYDINTASVTMHGRKYKKYGKL